jgi:adenosylcobinamide-GDP ribazoletransferase
VSAKRAADGGGRELRAGAAALAFLTTVPLARVVATGGEDLRRGTWAFPLVGAGVGAAVGGAGAALAHVLSASVAAPLALALGVVLTGALHLDGLADTADALGARSRERALAIMRDPRTGSYGVAAVALVLIVEAAALRDLVDTRRIAAVVCAFAASRAVAPLIAWALPYARPSSGLAQPLERRGAVRAAIGYVLAGLLVATIDRRDAAAMLACTAAVAVAASLFFRLRFGGMTGDTLGAAIAVSEAALLVIATR